MTTSATSQNNSRPWRSDERGEIAFIQQSQAARNQHSFLHNSTRAFTKAKTPRGVKRKSGARVLTSKQWDPIFYSPRACADSSFFEGVRAVLYGGHESFEAGGEFQGTDGEKSEQVEVVEPPVDKEHLLDIFLSDSEASIPSFEARTVREFFSKNVSHQTHSDTAAAWAWLDDREYRSGCSRAYPRFMDAPGLRKALKHKASHVMPSASHS
jgi:hypothetical protein